MKTKLYFLAVSLISPCIASAYDVSDRELSDYVSKMNLQITLLLQRTLQQLRELTADASTAATKIAETESPRVS